MSNIPQPATPAPLSPLQSDVYALATPAGRMVGTPGHTAAQAFLQARMTETGLLPYSGTSFALPYRGPRGPMVNLVGLLPGSDPSLAPLLLGAHYDTCGALPGADDNAAAVAALLGAVAPLRAQNLRRPVVFAFFDGEEPPHFQTNTMGSQRFYAHQRTGPIAAAIVLDLVGHALPVAGLEDLLFVMGGETHPDLATALTQTDPPRGVRILPTLHAYAPDLSDHTVFRINQRPFLFLSCGHGPHYHKATDTPDRIDYPKLRAVQETVVALVRNLEGAHLDHARATDTLPLELRRWNEIVGPIAPRLFGADLRFRDRASINAAAAHFTGHFGL